MGEVDIKKNYILYLKQGVKSIKGKSKENLLLFTYYGGKFEMAKGQKSGSLHSSNLPEMKYNSGKNTNIQLHCYKNIKFFTVS